MNIWWIKYLMTVEHMSVKFFDSVTMAASKRHLWQDNSKWSNLVVWNNISSEMYIHTSWLFCSMNRWTGYWSLTCTECHPETSLIKAASCYELLLFFSLFGCFFFFFHPVFWTRTISCWIKPEFHQAGVWDELSRLFFGLERERNETGE